MDIRVVGIDFPPPRTARQLTAQQLGETLAPVTGHIDKIEVYLSEFSADGDGSKSRCSMVVFFHGRLPMLVEEDADSLDRAISRCVVGVGRAVLSHVRGPGPGPAGLSALFE
ncbi:hypothetical protein FIV42_20535 [Persicimonas caeni]|jgi:hypothetical protein|uniref:HPF/RaiA family ribosome-associated protein n=1 Tax=Persicimonas caeni TaxID=2292766 RepID=A0A4Y6PXQ2_PERCE|nr:hypothetical protein [Persicimonas caeni]QDG53043.1 hypothetical protein FIV42_20535 [Persicimonas caeni]QED34265.1 hypothetical protein FRD00_20530 [Persicimonas caeni]